MDVDSSRMLKNVSAASLAGRLKERRLESTRRHGKYLFAEISGDNWLVLHFGMTGYLDYRKEEESVPEHSHLVFHFDNGYRLAGIWQRLLGRIGLANSPTDFIDREGLGPDAMEPEIGLSDFKQLFRGRRGSVKSALMDQSFIAGIGNIYSDEILFHAHLHPRAVARDLEDGELAALHEKMLHVLRIAIERQADPGRLPDSWLLPHREEGEKCPGCGGNIVSQHISGRTAYFCPRCQPERF